LHVSGFVHSVSLESPHETPALALFAAHAPLPLHVSGFVHSVSLGSPHEAPALALFARHVPLPLQLSGSVHSVSLGSPHEVPAVSSFTRHVPIPLQVSGFVQSVSVPLPHAVPEADRTSAGQVPLEPVQVSAGSHTPPARHCNPPARNVQVAVQHELVLPLAPPRSHASVPSTTLSPHTEAALKVAIAAAHWRVALSVPVAE